MTFSTLTFLLFFLPAVVLLYFAVPAGCAFKPISNWEKLKRGKHGYKNAVLLASSIFFYAWGEPVNIFLILLCVGITWGLSGHVEKGEKWALFSSVIVNLLPLIVLKYMNFFLENINRLMGANIPFVQFILPAGISFYTFQVLTYIIDLYRKKVKRQKNPAYLALYVFFFPQLIAGPIVRYVDIEEQIENRQSSWEGCYAGMKRFIIGLSKKMLIANQAGMVADAVAHLNPSEVGMGLTWIWAIAFGVQILFDFSGYSDMAIGIGRVFGFTFQENFRKPYHSASVTEFWRRWHISLSSFFRDYVYIPLGGSRVKGSRHIFNLGVVWLLTGFWHGAYWNYILWGLYYFLLLSGEKFIYGKYMDRLPYLVRRLITFLAYMFGWGIFLFESNSIAQIGRHLLKFIGVTFGCGGMTLSKLQVQGSFFVMLAGLLIAVIPWPERAKEKKDFRFSGFLCAGEGLGLLVLLGLSVFTIVSEAFNPFIYFRF